MSTIRDVAKMCGVSTATVSNVINARSAKVSAVTRERVLAAVRTLHYKPTPLEHSQKAIFTRNLALICGDLSMFPIESNHYFGRVFDGILEAAAFQKWSVTVFVERMWSEAGCAVRRSYDGRCDGVILLAPRRDCNLAVSLVERGVSVITVGTTAALQGVSSVDIDNEEAGAALTRHLLELGHARIAFYGPHWSIASSYERCSAYRNEMERAGFARKIRIFLSHATADLLQDPGEPPPDLLEFEWTRNEEALIDAAFRTGSESPTAIICWNEDYARKVIQSLVSAELAVPKNVSIVAFDDSELSVSATPHLTTMRQPYHKIGKRAVDMLISRIMNPELPDANYRYQAELVVRGSTGPPPSISNSRIRHINTQAIPTNGGKS